MNSVRTMTREIGVPHTHNPSWVVSSDDGALHRVLVRQNQRDRVKLSANAKIFVGQYVGNPAIPVVW